MCGARSKVQESAAFVARYLTIYYALFKAADGTPLFKGLNPPTVAHVQDQRNGFDCGVHVARFLELFSTGQVRVLGLVPEEVLSQFCCVVRLPTSGIL